MRTTTLIAALLLACRAPADDSDVRAALALAHAHARRSTAAETPPAKLAWTDDAATPGQLNLWRDGVQAGALNLRTGDYYAATAGKWASNPSVPPEEPPATMLDAATVRAEKVREVKAIPFAEGQVTTDGTRATPAPTPTAGSTGTASPSSTTTSTPARTVTVVPRADRRGSTATDLTLIYGSSYCPPGTT